MIFVFILSALANGYVIVPYPKTSEVLLTKATAKVLSDSFSQYVDTVFVTVLLQRNRVNLIGKILTHIDEPLPVAIQTVPQRTSLAFKQRYNLILLDSWLSLGRLQSFLTSKQFDFTGTYLMVVTSYNADCTSLADAILELTSNKFIYDVNVLFRQNESVIMKTYFPYGRPDRTRSHIARWNTYDLQGFINDRPHYPKKLENFYGSPLRVALFESVPFMKLIRNSNNRIIDYAGIDGHLLNRISRRLNMTITPVEPPLNEKWGTLEPDGTATGAIAMVMNGTANMTITFFGNNPLRQKFLAPSMSYYQSSLVLIVSPGSEYGTFEKLLLPFQLTLWIGFIIVFINALLIIAILQNFPLVVQRFVFGRRNKNPILNFYLATLGYPVDPPPTRNFSRFLLSLWIFGTFILRTAYQQEMFGFLHRPLNRSTVSGWDQFVSSGYHIFTAPTAEYLFDDAHAKIKSSISVLPSSDNTAILEAIRYGRARGACISYPELIAYLNQQALLDGGPFYQQFSERLYSYPIHVFFRKNSPLMKSFDEQIQPLVTHGYIQHWAHSILNRNLLRGIEARARQALAAQPLTLDMLAGVFGLYVIGLACAGLAFMAENSSANYRWATVLLTAFRKN
ncbi:AAEL003340-PA [Aedes aegypti]|uniref:AAEL003340-PA n=1 Tax=Aedes aegypti TaxID=7159 RepID=Q17FN1_AEDAE|nr:AAEL003340-PA [Aedes aegypti]